MESRAMRVTENETIEKLSNEDEEKLRKIIKKMTHSTKPWTTK
jgi:hypothetical protein